MDNFDMLKLVLSNQIRILSILGMMNAKKYHIKEIKEIIEDAQKDIREKLGNKKEEKF